MGLILSQPINFEIINSNIGESVKIEKIEDINLTMKDDIVKNDLFSHHEREMSISLSGEIDTIALFQHLGLDLSQKPDMCDILIQKPIQIRKHKKKRINKKWAKKYGFTIINIESKGYKVVSNSDGEYEFVKKC